MSFTEWYEAIYGQKWLEEYALYYGVRLLEDYEYYCKENNLEPIWNG
jgi:hypothetical protein